MPPSLDDAVARRAGRTRRRGCPSAGELAHRVAVGADRPATTRVAASCVEPAVPRRDLEARDQALDVPLPRPGQRLVEVVDVEHHRRARATRTRRSSRGARRRSTAPGSRTSASSRGRRPSPRRRPGRTRTATPTSGRGGAGRARGPGSRPAPGAGRPDRVDQGLAAMRRGWNAARSLVLPCLGRRSLLDSPHPHVTTVRPRRTAAGVQHSTSAACAAHQRSVVGDRSSGVSSLSGWRPLAACASAWPSPPLRDRVTSSSSWTSSRHRSSTCHRSGTSSRHDTRPKSSMSR